MSPIFLPKRTLDPTSLEKPSTWTVISVIGGAAWSTYQIFTVAKIVWIWIQESFRRQHNGEESLQQKKSTLHKRDVD